MPCEITPIKAITRQVPDISALLQFHWVEPVLYSVELSFPTDSPKKAAGHWIGGHWIGIAENQEGDACTYLILENDTQQVITHSLVPSALDPSNPNLHAYLSSRDGESLLHPSSHQLLTCLASILSHLT
jgi:hypothetical protein